MKREDLVNYKGSATHRWKSIRKAIEETAKETCLSTGQLAIVIIMLHKNILKRKNGFKGISEALDQIKIALEYHEK